MQILGGKHNDRQFVSIIIHILRVYLYDLLRLLIDSIDPTPTNIYFFLTFFFLIESIES